MGNSKTNYTVPFAIMSFLLFLLGFVTWINNILVPFMKAQFSITESQAQLVSAAFFSAYIISIPVGGVVKKIGYKKSVIIGSVITGIGCAIFVPALGIGYNMVLAGLFITAVGVVILQVAANPYVIALGTPETSASRLTLAMAINSSAAVLAPIIGGFIIESNDGNIIVHENMAKIMFIVLAAISILTAVILVFMHLPAIEGEEADASANGAGRSAWSFPHLILGFVAIGMYMGLEVGVGNYFLNYVVHNVGKPMAYATMILGFYPAGFFVGRLLGAGLLKKYESSKVLLVNSIVCVALLGLFFVTKGSSFSIWPLIAQGLFLSIMWSVLFDLSMKDIPVAAAKLGSGIICTGVVFVGVWMFIMGKVVDSTGTVLADGTIDASFLNSVHLDPASSGGGTTVNDFIVQPDGKVIIIGKYDKIMEYNYRDISRINADMDSLVIKDFSGSAIYRPGQLEMSNLNGSVPTYNLDFINSSFNAELTGLVTQPQNMDILLSAFYAETQMGKIWGSANIEKLKNRKSTMYFIIFSL